MSTRLGRKDIRNRKSEFVEKTQFLCFDKFFYYRANIVLYVTFSVAAKTIKVFFEPCLEILNMDIDFLGNKCTGNGYRVFIDGPFHR